MKEVCPTCEGRGRTEEGWPCDYCGQSGRVYPKSDVPMRPVPCMGKRCGIRDTCARYQDLQLGRGTQFDRAYPMDFSWSQVPYEAGLDYRIQHCAYYKEEA